MTIWFIFLKISYFTLHLKLQIAGKILKMAAIFKNINPGENLTNNLSQTCHLPLGLTKRGTENGADIAYGYPSAGRRNRATNLAQVLKGYMFCRLLKNNIIFSQCC